MAITESREWTVSLTRSEVTQKLADEVQRQDGEIVSLEPFVAKTGAFWKTRLLGAIFMRRTDLPTTIKVVIEEARNGVRVNATILDRFGFGFRTGIVGRFRTQCGFLLDALQEATAKSSSAEELRELKKLHEERAITDEEYEEKRNALVDRL